ncbi:DNA translocase FtsK [Desulfovibrio sp. 86]|uniref:Cell divisionFtsK/SpoIIIE n=1 Tax=uncultured Desulfovibrio sp. TaxID=167968 RepID=A0A212KXY5_9BACT|nr:Cell divisionFtsK/SpoIIIE [uncultured Desulfovibrio sp.]VZH35443.1 Cell divisionFtsK/SpoIIIE [Desulfovibrio sp. 86]
MLFWALLLLLSLLSFDANDPSLNHVVSGTVEVHNKAGLFGAYTAGFLNDVFGVAAFLCPLVFGALGAAYVSPAYGLHWWRWCGFFLLTICLLVTGAAWDFSFGDVWGGGMVGSALHRNASLYLSPGGSAIVWIFIFLAGLQLAWNISWFSLAGRLFHALRQRLEARLAAADEASQAEAAGKNGNKTGKSGSGPSVRQQVQPEIVQHTLTPVQEEKAVAASKFKFSWPDWSFLARWRDKLGDIHPTADSLPDVYDADGEKTSVSARAAESSPEPAASLVSASEDHEDDPFAVAQDLNGQPLVKGASRSGKAPSAAQSSHDEPTADDYVNTTDDMHSEAASAPSTAKDGHAASRVQEPSSKTGLVGKITAPFRKKAAIPLPGLDLLAPPSPQAGGLSREDLQARGQTLMACLNDFDIQSELVRITPGPVVTMFEVRPAPGIRVSRIANLTDDLALALKAVAIRIQAPIPGSDTVGIEIPNEQRETVNFRELAACEDFRTGCGPLTMILGKDIAGKPFMADLTRMPHLLVAGATGAGKSVCLNGILVSLLYRTQPQDMQLLLIDPKRIEMAVYADEPHLVHPVVTEMSEAKNALDWAVHEMDRRYAAMARLGVRNVAGFNQKLAAYKNDLPPDFLDLEPLPYLVIVIDELADLMMTAAREVETSIVRLAQLARAAGIHLILATQRPSVDVVTGLIKANFPCRISFQVTSKHDSRTILDQVGAEHLLGRGDMLFKPSGGRLQRLHGPFLSDEEVQDVVNHWKRHVSPSYKVDFAQWGLDAAMGGASGGAGDAAQDPLYGEVQVFVSEQGRASISLVQRRFKIGFNRAARLVEQLEHDGIIGPADGSKPRAVVK